MTQLNFDQARFNMIEQQIRTWEVLDTTVLDLVGEIYREDFLPGNLKQLALADISLPLAHGQVTMTPKVEARILQSLSVKPTDAVLEIGTGCGYLTALLAKSAKSVTSVDIFPEFCKQAEIKLAKYGIENVTLEQGNAIQGWQKSAPYDVIVVTASLPVFTSCFQKQLEINGRLFMITGSSPVMDAMLITRSGPQDWAREIIFETDIPAMIGARVNKEFTF